MKLAEQRRKARLEEISVTARLPKSWLRNEFDEKVYTFAIEHNNDTWEFSFEQVGDDIWCKLSTYTSMKAVIAVRVLAQETGFNDLTTFEVCDSPEEPQDGSSVCELSIKDMLDRRNGFITLLGRSINVRAEIHYVARYRDDHGVAFPVCLHLKVPQKQFKSQIFLRGDLMHGGDAVVSHGWTWMAFIRLKEIHGALKFCIGVEVYNFEWNAPFPSVKCVMKINGLEKVEKQSYSYPDDEGCDFAFGDPLVPAMNAYNAEEIQKALKNGPLHISVEITDNAEQVKKKADKHKPVHEVKPMSSSQSDRNAMGTAALWKKQPVDSLQLHGGNANRRSESGTVDVGDYSFEGAALGKGGFGAVYKGQHKKTNKHVAIKVIQYEGVTEMVVNEIVILKELCRMTEHLVELLDVSITKSRVYLVMELCNAGDLAQYINTKGPLSDSVVRHFLRHIVSAMKVLNCRGIIHRDLKPHNLLLHNKTQRTNPKPYNLTLKVADFGVARYLEEDSKAGTIVGTTLYMAPEILRSSFSPDGAKYTAVVDLWSIGIVLYECVMGVTLLRTKTSRPT
jgi:tRNA A-37 threonylcarbamoyl transferase component Bud32